MMRGTADVPSRNGSVLRATRVVLYPRSVRRPRRLSMLNAIRRLLRDHRDYLALAAVLVLSSAAGLALLAFRLYYSGTAGYIFMPWNLFLAWVPLAFALPLFVLARRGRSRAATLWTLGLLWLLFFPNAPYLLSEFVHLQ